ncbi:MAG: hypothetical protein CL578_22390 [Alteromonadaceae bacterium]|jgi:hypothetical protein|uniref:phage tail terminator-like protein n=1 Tax=unclassified Methylophaga TaxID=2629249 RepID=UPI000C5C3E70|nr:MULTISPECIES: phage tail terminator-like protein [unclassified Methylophaga]MBN27777.1 hypothetical protein [Alteromonadaceae bacterium]MAP27789.1 hypothetical protein [Methylophaga sp.]HAD31525.1 hypothetical protein [Methylophaga sp.]HBX60968.1 hypothetical protein [Methylophaga sp.]HCN99397.1 hypothetical protein [Methylophaga sp.]|tara:strand:- start:21598 stop:22011 length:414 start_codon:yes stop_codon:yes gene_type:complete
MANNLQQRNILTTLLVNAITAAGISKIKVPNGSFETPDNELWARITLLSGDLSFFTYGNGKDRMNGIAQIDLFAPKGSGVITSLTKADAISQDISHQDITESGFQLRTFESTVKPKPDEDVWYGIMIELRFDAFHIR